MPSRRLKTGYFVVEGINSFSTVYYFYYFYFYMQKVHGYGNRANLVLAALNGAVYALCTIWGGKFGQKFGYFRALKVGFAIMLGSLLVGAWLSAAWTQALVMLTVVLGMSFTWPILEALVSEGEDRIGLQHMVGVYNVVWAGTAAIGYFIGGALLDKLGFQSLFYVPCILLAVQFGLTWWLEGHAKNQGTHLAPTTFNQPPHPVPGAAGFLRMAWVANPFAYIAINTMVAVMPGIATRLGLSTTLAGFCASVWCFSRLGAFAALWMWDGWHYRFRFMLSAYISLLAGFVLVLMAPNVAVLVCAQIILGAGIGLLYYSSLFYSMDIGETKGEHGGFHESVIGLGNLAGPAVGAASLYILPQYPNGGTIAVGGLLVVGLAALGWVWRGRAQS